MKPSQSPLTKKQIALSLLVIAFPLWLWSLTYTEQYRNWHWQRASVAEMRREVVRHPNDATLLYHLGSRLSQEGQYPAALPLLERATGLSLDKAEYRDAWAKALLATGQISQAFGVLSQFIKTHPESPEGHLYMARFYVAQNATKRACEELDEATNRKTGLTEAWWLKAVAYQAMNENPMALQAIQKAVALDGKNATYQALLGELLLATRDKAGALAAFDAALQRDPKMVAAHLFRARLLLDANRPADALAASERAHTLDPQNDVALFLQGRSLLALGRAAEAVAPLEQAATLAPDNPSPVADLRDALRKCNRLPEATRWDQERAQRTARRAEQQRLEENFRQHPDDPTTSKALATFWAGRGNVTQTVRYYARSRNMEQDAPLVLIDAANDLTAHGFPDQAIELIKRVQAQTKMNPASFEAMGNALLAKGQVREAAVPYETAASWWPQKRAVYQKKISDYFAEQAAHPTEAMRLYKQAIQEERSRVGPALSSNHVRELLRQAVALEPNNTQIRRDWVRVLFERREQQEAIQAAQEMLAISPADTATHARLAVLLLQNASNEANYNTIQGHLNQAKSDPTVAPLVYYGAGSLALRRNQADAALVALRTARRLAPGSEPICYALAQAERLNGHNDEAQKLLQEYEGRRAANKAEVEMLNFIADHPNDIEGYRVAITYYTKRGQSEQAEAIRREMQRRFRLSANSSTLLFERSNQPK